MEQIQDRANKFFNDVRKKKIKVSKNIYKDNKEKVKQGSIPISDLSNSCFYCPKVFYSSRFLLSHVLRRHSEDLLLLYKKWLNQESNNNSSDMKQLISFLKDEFVMLKSELKIVKMAAAGEIIENDNGASKGHINRESLDNICTTISEIKAKTNNDTEVHSNELAVLKERVSDLEGNSQCLENKFKELDNVLKTDVLLKKDIQHITFNNENILRAQEGLRQTLLNDLQTKLSKQLYENNSEMKSEISELKLEIKRLDWVIDDFKKQVGSSEHMKAHEEIFERQIINFLNSPKHKDKSKKCLKSKRASQTVSECNKFDQKVIAPTKHRQVPEISHISKELDFKILEKFSSFGIAPNSSKMSCVEFDEKFKLVESEKEHLEKRYPNFSEVYDKINKFTNHEVKSKLPKKKSRKIRFSEPLTSSTNISHSLVSIDNKFLNKTFPPVQNENQHLTAVKNLKFSDYECKEFTAVEKRRFIPESEGFNFTDAGSCDYSGSHNNSSEDILESTPVKSGLKTSCPIEDTEESKKTRNINFSKNSVCNLKNSMPSCSTKTLDCTSYEMQRNSNYTVKEYTEQVEEVFVTNLEFVEAKNCNYNYDGDDFDDNASLKSLSSFED